jgi:hypothetical protein
VQKQLGELLVKIVQRRMAAVALQSLLHRGTSARSTPNPQL